MPFDVNSWRKRIRVSTINLLPYLDANNMIDVFLDMKILPYYKLYLNSVEFPVYWVTSYDFPYYYPYSYYLFVKYISEIGKTRIFYYHESSDEISNLVLKYNLPIGLGESIDYITTKFLNLTSASSVYWYGRHKTSDLVSGTFSESLSSGDRIYIVANLIDNVADITVRNVSDDSLYSTIHIRQDGIYEDTTQLVGYSYTGYHLITVKIYDTYVEFYLDNDLVYTYNYSPDSIYFDVITLTGSDIIHFERVRPAAGP